MMWKRNIITQILRARRLGPEGWTRATARGLGLGPDSTDSNKNIPKHPGGAPARGIGLGPDPTESNKNIPKHPADLSNKAENPVSDPYGLSSNMKLVGAGAALASLITLGMCYMKGGDEKEDGDSSKPKYEVKSNEPAAAADAGPKEGAEETEKDSKKEETKKLDTDLEIENIAENGEPKEEDKRDDYVPQFSS